MVCSTSTGSTRNSGWVIADGNKDGAAGFIEFSFASAAGDYVAKGPYKINDGNWHHVAMAADLINLNAVIYIDGAQVTSYYLNGSNSALATATIPTITMGNVNTGYGIFMGTGPGGTYNYVNGGYSIDDLCIWRRLLTASDAASIYAAGEAGLNATAWTPLTISANATTLQVNWYEGTLQSATNLTGPWTPVAGAVPPSYTNALPSVPTFYMVHP
jgi:hypothetical protein